MRIIAFLFTLMISLLACKKEKEPRTFKGVVLRRHDQKPVTDAKVNLSFIRKTGQYAFIPILYTATTDKNGEYIISVSDVGTEPTYYSFARKSGHQQIEKGKSRLISGHLMDTIILDDASYLKIDLLLKTFPPNTNGIFLSLIRIDWAFMSPTGLFDIKEESENKFKTYGPPLATDVHLDSFSYFESKKALIRLYTQESGPSKILLEKEVVLDSLTTTEVKIEY
jgi:hypothetical protein